jgi:hypothetical protein
MAENKNSIWIILLVAFVLWILYKNKTSKANTVLSCNAVTQISVPTSTSFSTTNNCPVIPKPIVISSSLPAACRGALCRYNALNAGISKTVGSGAVSVAAATNPIGEVAAFGGTLVKTLTECFCQVNALYGAALRCGVATGRICPNFPTPASRTAQLRLCLHATSGVRRAALGCIHCFCY